MPAPQTERLRGIKTLPQLLAYLRDELDWPIGADDIEYVTYEYTRQELGSTQGRRRIKEIKQLRPLNVNQPWGIFFVNFEKKRLPVVVLRASWANSWSRSALRRQGGPASMGRQ